MVFERKMLRDVSEIKENVQRENIRSSTLMMEAAHPSETPVNVHHATWCYILKGCENENLKYRYCRRLGENI
jgi:hypothetical protein